MKLDRVTFTGADESVEAGELIELSARYPFIEWGILVSRSQEGSPRFPSKPWREELQFSCRGLPISLSLHLCGTWLRKLLLGENALPVGMTERFNRMQLNFHGESQRWEEAGLVHALYETGIKDIIFQIDGNQGQDIIGSVDDGNQAFSCHPLFDLSHGAGVSPQNWPEPFDEHTYHGYAGGLGPDNLAAELPRIAEAAGTYTRIWIDMETKIRSYEGRRFDLKAVEECCKIAEKWVTR